MKIYLAILTIAVSFLTYTISTDQRTSFKKYGAGGSAGVDATQAFFGPTGIIQDRSSPTVFMPPGEYDITSCSAQIPYMASSVELVGAGRGKTIIKLLATSCANSLFAWTNAVNAGLRDLTIDINGAMANQVANSQVLFVSASRDFSLDNIEIKGLSGDHWIALHSVGSTHGRISHSQVSYSDCTNDFGGGVLLDNSYFGGQIRAGIDGTTMTVTSVINTQGQPTIGSPNGIANGLHITGHDANGHIVSLNTTVVTQVDGTPGGTGTYKLTKSSTIASGTPLYVVANDDWQVDHSVFHNTIMAFAATNVRSNNNEIDGWCSGGGIIVDGSAAGFISQNDYIHNGSYMQDANGIFDAGLEDHADESKITNLRVEDVGDVCIGINGFDTTVLGGSCWKFAQAATVNTSPAIFFDAVHFTVNDSNSAGSSVTGMTIRSSGTAGEKFGIGDQGGVGTTFAQNDTIIGVSVSPYHVVGGLVISDPDAGMTVAQLSNVRPNKGTELGVIDAKSPTSSMSLEGGGAEHVQAIGTGSAFVAR